MICHHSRDTQAWTAGIWLIGIGVLFLTRMWWPGLLVLIGITAIVQAVVGKQGMNKVHGGLWAILIGVWAALRFNMAFLLIGLGVFVIIKSTLKATEMAEPKPYYDNRLD